MHAHPNDPPVECRLTEAETIALAYHRAARGDAWTALVRAVEDALADLAEAERRTMQRDRLISRGFVRGAVQRCCRADEGMVHTVNEDIRRSRHRPK